MVALCRGIHFRPGTLGFSPGVQSNRLFRLRITELGVSSSLAKISNQRSLAFSDFLLNFLFQIKTARQQKWKSKRFYLRRDTYVFFLLSLCFITVVTRILTALPFTLLGNLCLKMSSWRANIRGSQRKAL